MRNKILTLIMCMLAALIQVSCDDSTAGYTRITYYPSLTTEGDQYIFMHLNETYQEPGYYAELAGEDVTSEVTVRSNLNTSASGLYTIKYSITNSDGFNVEATRYVVVTDPSDPVEGVYYTDADSYRVAKVGGAVIVYGNSFRILVFSKGNGTYSVDDLFGGYYAQRANYGSLYAMGGNISVDSSGTVTMLNSYVQGWGDSADSLENGTFNAGTLYWELSYADSYVFHVTMYKK